MQKNPGNLSMQDIMGMMKSPAGQQLMALLRQTDSAALNEAVEKAKRGDISQAKESLAPLLSNEEVLKLLKQMEG